MQHIHGYSWLGEKSSFDKESERRPESPAFAHSELPPIQTGNWLLKPVALIRGTWEEPKEAGEWLGRQLDEFAPRFAFDRERDAERLGQLVRAAVERVGWGGDVSYGHYLRGSVFHSLALVTCRPSRAAQTAEPRCPLGGL
ncbi:hypothetical protein [Streptomyces sp. NPDC059743]|uniref:hypothetical protein n=1 Tax=Streptomyces sp. NPDC059743 TaxID=3346928 RepID=UPI00365568B9